VRPVRAKCWLQKGVLKLAAVLASASLAVAALPAAAAPARAAAKAPAYDGPEVAKTLPPRVRAGLQKALQGLPASTVALIEAALARRPLQRVERAVARLDALPPAKRQGMVTTLRNGLAPLTEAERAAVIDGLIGVAGARELAALGALSQGAVAEIVALFHQYLDALPAYFGDPGDPNATSFIDQVFSLMQPNLTYLLTNALANVPTGARALVAEADVAGTATLGQRNNPGALGSILLILQSASAEQFVQGSAYEAGGQCGLGNCTAFDYFVIEVSGVHVMPELIQSDFINCAYSPVCTPVEYQGIVQWIEIQIQSTEAQQALVNDIAADFAEDTANISQNWIEAYQYVGEAAQQP
jgi:hypothetical protein